MKELDSFSRVTISYIMSLWWQYMYMDCCAFGCGKLFSFAAFLSVFLLTFRSGYTLQTAKSLPSLRLVFVYWRFFLSELLRGTLSGSDRRKVARRPPESRILRRVGNDVTDAGLDRVESELDVSGLCVVSQSSWFWPSLAVETSLAWLLLFNLSCPRCFKGGRKAHPLPFLHSYVRTEIYQCTSFVSQRDILEDYITGILIL